MNKLVILGAGTAGTMLSNTLRRALDSDWSITVIDQDDDHQYQPGFLFVPFGKMPPARVTRSRRSLIPDGVDFIQRPIAKVHPHNNLVELADGGEVAYDWLIIASGCAPRPEATPGLTDERVWRKSAHDFYTLDGARAL
ncbi:MAG TPA: FAD-dependent oxidoreductase, partial [Marmoricola sp.]|nr:FAD-dependent oxidoreductase [Marmoricola sp.]